MIEFSCPADINIFRKINKKINTYGPLLRKLQILYLEYIFEMIAAVVGALSYVPKCLIPYLSELGFNNIEISKIIQKMQNVSVSGTMKICKIFLNFNDGYGNLNIFNHIFN